MTRSRLSKEEVKLTLGFLLDPPNLVGIDPNNMAIF